MRHADGFCQGQIRLIQSFYGQHQSEVYLECVACGQHVGSIPDVEVDDERDNPVASVQSGPESSPVCQGAR